MRHWIIWISDKNHDSQPYLTDTNKAAVINEAVLLHQEYEEEVARGNADQGICIEVDESDDDDVTLSDLAAEPIFRTHTSPHVIRT